MPPSLHAVLGASSAHRWLACTPSARLAERLEERFGKKESSYAKDPERAKPFVDYNISRSKYMTGDCCVYEGKVWRSTIDDNVWTPTAYPQGWASVNAE